MSVMQMSPRTYEPRMREMGYGAYGAFSTGSGPKVEAELLSLKSMLMSDLDIITKLKLQSLVPQAQAIMIKVQKALLIVNREKELDQWGSKAHDTATALIKDIGRDQSVLATKIATTSPTPVKVAKTANGNGGNGGGFTTNQKMAAVGGVGLLAVLALVAFK